MKNMYFSLIIIITYCCIRLIVSWSIHMVMFIHTLHHNICATKICILLYIYIHVWNILHWKTVLLHGWFLWGCGYLLVNRVICKSLFLSNCYVIHGCFHSQLQTLILTHSNLTLIYNKWVGLNMCLIIFIHWKCHTVAFLSSIALKIEILSYHQLT